MCVRVWGGLSGSKQPSLASYRLPYESLHRLLHSPPLFALSSSTFISSHLLTLSPLFSLSPMFASPSTFPRLPNLPPLFSLSPSISFFIRLLCSPCLLCSPHLLDSPPQWMLRSLSTNYIKGDSHKEVERGLKNLSHNIESSLVQYPCDPTWVAHACMFIWQCHHCGDQWHTYWCIHMFILNLGFSYMMVLDMLECLVYMLGHVYALRQFTSTRLSIYCCAFLLLLHNISC